MSSDRKGLSRRDFLKLTGATAVAGTTATAVTPGVAGANERENRIKGAKATTTICPYCAVGCGMVAYSKNGKVVHVEGDPEHPINKGALCSKGASLLQMANDSNRQTTPLYRAPGASDWEEKSWDWMVTEIAKRVKKSRDESFVTRNSKGQEVNRCDGIAHVGSAALDNEECYILQKWMRSLGLVYIEHQARI
jgi:formate dehydrogenase major subunit